MLTVTVTNNNDKDALTVQCNLLKDIKADIRQHKSLLKPGNLTNTANNITKHIQVFILSYQWGDCILYIVSELVMLQIVASFLLSYWRL